MNTTPSSNQHCATSIPPGRKPAPRKLSLVACLFAASALFAADALAGTNYNSSRSNRGRRPSVAYMQPATLDLVRQPRGFAHEGVISEGGLVIQGVRRGRYILTVRADRAGPAIDGIENDAGPIRCDWSETHTVTCNLRIRTEAPRDVAIQIFTCADDECREAEGRDRSGSAMPGRN